jgi:predicted outer membrane lipoprotein
MPSALLRGTQLANAFGVIAGLKLANAFGVIARHTISERLRRYCAAHNWRTPSALLLGSN